MNWFQRIWSTPKFHAALSVAATIATALVPPQYQLVAGALAGLLGTNAAILPHPEPMPVLTQGGSLHAQDYAAIVSAVAGAVKAQADPPPKT